MKKWLMRLGLALVMTVTLLPIKTMAAEEMKVIHASTDEELSDVVWEAYTNGLENTIIELDGREYADYLFPVQNLRNVILRGTQGTKITTERMFTFRNCKDTTIDTVTFVCTAPDDLVDNINIDESEIEFKNCIIEGGGFGLEVRRNTDAIEFRASKAILTNSIVRNCVSGIVQVYDGCEAIFQDCTLSGNGSERVWTAIDKVRSGSNETTEKLVTFKGCEFLNNPNKTLGEEICVFENCTFSGNGWGDAGDRVNTISAPKEYVYDVEDPGENTNLPPEALDKVTDAVSAADAVKEMTSGMTSEQKVSATGVDLATLYAETAAAKAASKEVEGDVIISAASTADLAAEAAQAVSAVETALVNGGVTTARYLANTVTLTTDETGEITIKIDPDILTTDVDKIRVETPSYALTLKIADLAEDLTEVLTITAHEVGEIRTQGVGAGFLSGAVNRKVSVRINLPKGRLTNPVTVSLPTGSGATTYQAVVQSDGTATSSKYNPVTTSIDGKVNTSGTYTVQTNEKSFTDISNKSAEMQKAILYLTSKGIINGTSATEFSPDGTINRQQIAALIMRALGKVDSTATATFTDVSKSSGLYHAIASSQKHKVINGYSDNTFRGANVISRAQIVTVAGRVLTTEMNYKAPANMNTYLSRYSDTVPDYAREMVALAIRENLVVYRTDGTFSGAKNMTRGDAAIILYRLFQRIW